MPKFKQDYSTLDSLRATRQFDGDDNDDNALLKTFIHAASNWFSNQNGRSFVPYTDTRGFDALYNPLLYARTLDLDEDLLAVTSITNGDDTTVVSSDYVLQPSNFSPKFRIQLKMSSGLNWTWGTDWENSISVTGIWGYHEGYSRAWKSETTVTASVSASGTLVPVASVSNLEVLGYILVSTGEQMQITATAAGTMTVERAVNGTTAGTLVNGNALSAYQQTPAVQNAVNRLASFLYDRRDTIGNRVQFADGTSFLEGKVPPEVRDVAQYYRRIGVRGSDR